MLRRTLHQDRLVSGADAEARCLCRCRTRRGEETARACAVSLVGRWQSLFAPFVELPTSSLPSFGALPSPSERQIAREVLATNELSASSMRDGIGATNDACDASSPRVSSRHKLLIFNRSRGQGAAASFIEDLARPH